MTTNKICKLQGLAAGVAVLTMLLAACSKAPAPASEAPANDTPATTPAPSSETPPANSAEPAQPAPTPPPPTDPSAAPKPTAAAAEPALESMQRATPSAKISVPVELRYQFVADPANNGALTLHLAAVPRSAGTGLTVSVNQAEGIAMAGSAIRVQKVDAAGIYRQKFAVTRSGTTADTLRVLVTMDMPEGKAFGYYSIPLAPTPSAAKPADGNPPQELQSVKQR